MPHSSVALSAEQTDHRFSETLRESAYVLVGRGWRILLRTGAENHDDVRETRDCVGEI